MFLKNLKNYSILANMSIKQVDILNIGLILLSGILAYNFPLEVFIFSLAILGPLHYLTEINWLDKKNYFTSVKKKYWLIIAVVSTLVVVTPHLYFEFNTEQPSLLLDFFLFINKWSNAAIFICFAISIGFLFIRKTTGWILLSIIALIVAILLNRFNVYSDMLGLFVPTIIHVYLFTLIFMLYGAKKSSSKYGYYAVIMAILVPIVFTVVNVNPDGYLFDDRLKSIFLENRLHVTPALFSKYIGISDGTSFYFYERMELRLMMFISFIYLYHYLNWFSKTSIISWHKNLTLKTSLIIGTIWIVLLILFLIDYRIGFLSALLFSFLHVILELPLNMVSIKEVFTK